MKAGDQWLTCLAGPASVLRSSQQPPWPRQSLGWWSPGRHLTLYVEVLSHCLYHSLILWVSIGKGSSTLKRLWGQNQRLASLLWKTKQRGSSICWEPILCSSLTPILSSMLIVSHKPRISSTIWKTKATRPRELWHQLTQVAPGSRSQCCNTEKIPDKIIWKFY